jgi:formylglycine-generating enzyme required for sulfatase activity
MDVAGNAFEWVADLYDVLYYSYAPNENPMGPDFSRDSLLQPPENQYGYPIFSIRGGSNVDRAWYMRTAHRHWGHHGDFPYTDIPYFRSYRVGFRCARSIEN